jgi:hypothetical protein
MFSARYTVFLFLVVIFSWLWNGGGSSDDACVFRRCGYMCMLFGTPLNKGQGGLTAGARHVGRHYFAESPPPFFFTLRGYPLQAPARLKVTSTNLKFLWTPVILHANPLREF